MEESIETTEYDHSLVTPPGCVGCRRICPHNGAVMAIDRAIDISARGNNLNGCNSSLIKDVNVFIVPKGYGCWEADRKLFLIALGEKMCIIKKKLIKNKLIIKREI